MKMCQQNTVLKRTQLRPYHFLEIVILGTSQNKSKENFPLWTNCSENTRIFYAICDKTVSMCDLITPKADKLTNFRHFRLEISVCIASAVGASDNFWHVTAE